MLGSKQRNLIGLALAAAILGFTAPSALAADAGHLRIQNKSKFFITYIVPFDKWNCNDAPQRGYAIYSLAPGQTTAYFEFLRTDGHGCNGRQGEFAMIPSIPTYAAQTQQFSYDSHGAMGLEGPNPNYASQLNDDGNHNYTWAVSPSQ